MEIVLNFFSDLILFTLGLIVITFWIFVFIEIWDTIVDVIKSIFGKSESTALDEDDYPENEIR